VTQSDVIRALQATWPAAKTQVRGRVTLRQGLGGGSRVSAATINGVLTPQDLQNAETAMQAAGQNPLFMIQPDDDANDHLLAQAGYLVKDPTVLYRAASGALPRLQTGAATQEWPPTAAQQARWAVGGIGPARLAVMARAACTKTCLALYCGVSTAATPFAALHERIVRTHPLDVAPAFRRQRFGAQLTAAAAAWGQKQGAATLALATTRANTGANALYSSLGMQIVGGYHYRIKPDP